MAFLIGGANSAADDAYEVANSCRFDTTSTTYMTKTAFSNTGTNAFKFTFSCWVKRANLGVNQRILTAGDSTRDGFTFNTSDQLQFFAGSNASGEVNPFVTNRRFRDPSAWYNLVIACDSELSGATNQTKLYVNGTLETSFSATAAVDDENTWHIGNNKIHRIGTDSDDSLDYYLDGYLAEVVLIDGQQLDATSFGEFDSDSPTIWKPKDVSGLTFGTNGFYLDFEDSGNLGDDESGNTHDFAETNLAAIDQTADTPTNNWCVYNSVFRDHDGTGSATVKEGNLDLLSTSGSMTHMAGTHAFSSGKWYYEVKWLSGSGDNVTKVGWGNLDQTSTPNTASIVYRGSDGKKYIDNTGTSYGDTFVSANDLVSAAIDLDSGTKTVEFWKNGTSQGSITISGKLDDGGFVVPYCEIGNEDRIQINFGNPVAANSSDAADDNGYGAFEYAPPSGFLALNSKNIGDT